MKEDPNHLISKIIFAISKKNNKLDLSEKYNITNLYLVISILLSTHISVSKKALQFNYLLYIKTKTILQIVNQNQSLTLTIYLFFVQY